MKIINLNLVFLLILIPAFNLSAKEISLECKGKENTRWIKGDANDRDTTYYLDFDEKTKMVNLPDHLMDCYSSELAKYYKIETCKCEISERYVSCNSKLIITKDDYKRESTISLDRYSGKLYFRKRFWGYDSTFKQIEDTVVTSTTTCSPLSKKF